MKSEVSLLEEEAAAHKPFGVSCCSDAQSCLHWDIPTLSRSSDPGIELTFPALQAPALPLSHQGSPLASKGVFSEHFLGKHVSSRDNVQPSPKVSAFPFSRAYVAFQSLWGGVRKM